jgi:predicted nucleotidyltransferase
MDFSNPFGGLIPGPQGQVLSALLRTSTPLTGRQIHRLVGAGRSLASTQQAITALIDLGVINVTQAGRAHLHVVNPDHYAVSPLRMLLDPVGLLEGLVRSVVDPSVRAVVLFGSVARGEATERSDIDLAVIAPGSWPGRVDLAEAVTRRMGNACDVIVFTPEEFARSKEPVVEGIVRDGVALYGEIPTRSVAAS